MRTKSSVTSGAPSKGCKGQQLRGERRRFCLPRVASHYVQDAHQPLHASNNYDGQLTGQRGIHSRFERDLFERFESRLTSRPPPPKSISSARDCCVRRAARELPARGRAAAADKEAIGSKDVYDDAYFEAFFAKVKPMLEERLASAITATASVIMQRMGTGREAVT